MGGIRGRALAPYLLLAPGIAWLILFFVVPMYYLAITSLQTGSLEVGYTFNWAWNNYSDAITTYHTQFFRSIKYAGIATVDRARSISYPLAYWIAFRGGRWKNLFLLLVIAPFFVTYLIRTLAWETILVRQRRRGRLRCSAIHVLGPERAPARDVGRRGRGHHLQLPAVHGPAALREPRADRPAAARGGATISTRAGARRSCA